MSRALAIFWIALLCDGLLMSLAAKPQESKRKTSDLSKRWFWSCSGDRPGGHHWNNEWDKRLYFECPQAHSISSIYSIYRGCRKDRLFEFKCNYNFAAGKDCSWQGYVNNFDGPINFRCGDGKFLAGVDSYHQNHQEDRRFKFKCCGIPSSYYHTSGCYKTSHVNNFKGVLDYKVPQFHYLVGAYSEHLNSQEDRRWKFEVCKIPAEP